MDRVVGENPPYHAPVFVLTHHPREPLAMKDGTTFQFRRSAGLPSYFKNPS